MKQLLSYEFSLAAIGNSLDEAIAVKRCQAQYKKIRQ